MTLAAFALENVLKGLMIAADQSLIQPRASAPEILFDKRVQTHDLLKLADHARVVLSEEERTVLERLRAYPGRSGRDPIIGLEVLGS